MASTLPLADRLRRGIARINEGAGVSDQAALLPLRRSLESTLARLAPGNTMMSTPFRFQLTGSKPLLFQGTEALPLEPGKILLMLNGVGVELQSGESLYLDGELAAWVLRPEVTLTDNNLRQADINLKSLGTGRDRDHAAAEAAETMKVRLRSRLTRLVTALQAAQMGSAGGAAAPLPTAVLEMTPIPAVRDTTPPPAPAPVVVAPPPPAPPAPAAPTSAPVLPAVPEPEEPAPPEPLLARALQKLLKAIEGSGFKCAVVGDVGGRAYGSTLPLRRLELLVSFEGPQRDNVLSAARAEGFQPAPDDEPLHFQHVDDARGDVARVDILQAVSPFQRQVLARSQASAILGTPTRVATCEDLILLRAGTKSLADWRRVVELLRVTSGTLDGVYLKKEAEANRVFNRVKAAVQQSRAQG